MTPEELLAYDQAHVWHPYSSMTNPLPMQLVTSADGSYIELADGKKLIDGMSSWWSVLHGYNHPILNQALIEQSQKMSHVMFGGLTHEPAIQLSKQLVELSPEGLEKVFLSDSGSVSVEVAMKMAMQYWQARGQPEKCRFLALENGYHGDTLGAMSVCDPVSGMHHIFANNLMPNYFTQSPQCKLGDTFDLESIQDLKLKLERHKDELAALILEPIVQGTGGMKFYHENYLKSARKLCDQYDVLLIADEIATGFGRTGKWFGCDHAGISPDIMCLGKTLTGGYMSLAATLATDKIASTISESEASCFMHGPTFMGNPLACAVSSASIRILQTTDWQSKVKHIASVLEEQLKPAKALQQVADVRVLGAIAVIEMQEAVDMRRITNDFINAGVWLRPFGRLVYIMPNYNMSDEELFSLAKAMVNVVGLQ